MLLFVQFSNPLWSSSKQIHENDTRPDTEGGPNATRRDPARLVVHVSQAPQKRPISPIPKPQPDGPPNQDGSTDDDSPATQQYLSLANHLLLPHRVSRGRGGAALPPRPPRRRRRASSGCASRRSVPAPYVIGLRLTRAVFCPAGSEPAVSLSD